MSVFNVTVIRPESFLHSSGFTEVVDSLGWALSALGHQVSISQNTMITEEGTNIVFGCELLGNPLPDNAIIYNLEQPTHPRMDAVRELAKGHQVWDYSATNFETWKSLGYDVKHVPIGYAPILSRIPDAEKKDISVLFYGWMTPRRCILRDRLLTAGIYAHFTDSCYGGSRDNLISRAKVVLNIHHDGRDLFEIVRVSYLMANAKCVVSEPSSDSAEYQDLFRGFITTRYDGIVEKCRELIRPRSCTWDTHFTDMQQIALDKIKQRNYVMAVAAALGQNTDPLTSRYDKALTEGDIKDYLPWLRANAKGEVLEIGVRDGASTSALLLGVQENGGHLYSYDIDDCSHLWKHPQWTFQALDSKKLSAQAERYEMAFIDGDHTRAGYLSDLNLCWNSVKVGGKIVSHDIDPERVLEDFPESQLPSRAIREEYFRFASEHGAPHIELPGKGGLGVITKI